MNLSAMNGVLAPHIPPEVQEGTLQIIEGAERVLLEIAEKDQRHPTFIYLQFKENPNFRKEILRKIAYDIPTYVKIGGDYAIKRHARAFLNTLSSTARRTNALLIGQLETDHLREFLLACMIVLHSLLPEYQKLMVDVRELIPQFQSRPEFQSMSLEEWKTSVKFRNYLVVSLQFISPAHNKVKMINSAAMLCGINNCLQGGGRTTQARRLYSIFDQVASAREGPPKSTYAPAVGSAEPTDSDNKSVPPSVSESDTSMTKLDVIVQLKHSALFSGVRLEGDQVLAITDGSYIGEQLGQFVDTKLLFNPVATAVGPIKYTAKRPRKDGQAKEPRKRKTKADLPEVRLQEEHDAVQALLFLTNPGTAPDSSLPIPV